MCGAQTHKTFIHVKILKNNTKKQSQSYLLAAVALWLSGGWKEGWVLESEGCTRRRLWDLPFFSYQDDDRDRCQRRPWNICLQENFPIPEKGLTDVWKFSNPKSWHLPYHLPDSEAYHLIHPLHSQKASGHLSPAPLLTMRIDDHIPPMKNP